MVEADGILYLRTARGSYPVIYGPDEEFSIGGCKLHHAGDNDQVTLIGAGVTLHECLAAAKELAKDGIPTRVIDLYSIKPLNRDALSESCRATNGKLVVVEDHYPEGGIGGAVMEALADANIPNLQVTPSSQ